MNISFKTHFPWPGPDGQPEPTGFERKILNARSPGAIDDYPREWNDLNNFPQVKYHTIRRVPATGRTRYRIGMQLTMCTGSRFKPKPFAHAVCTAVQNIHISMMYNVAGQLLIVEGSKGRLSLAEIRELADNDGLTLEQFTRWFLLDVMANGPGTYQVVQWWNEPYFY